MTLRRIDRPQWAGFCKVLSRQLLGKQAEITVASMEFGAQIEAQWLPITGLVYDPHTDAFEIALEGLDHTVFHPLKLYAEFGLGGVESLAIIEMNATQIVIVRDTLMLPRPRV